MCYQSLACLKCNLLITPLHGESLRGWSDNKGLFSQSWWESWIVRRQSGDSQLLTDTVDFQCVGHHWISSLSTGFQIGLGHRPEWFYFSIALSLSETHTPSFSSSALIPILVSAWAQFKKKSNSYRQTHFLCRDTKLRQISLAFLWKWDCRCTWPLVLKVKEHKPLCPKFPI